MCQKQDKLAPFEKGNVITVTVFYLDDEKIDQWKRKVFLAAKLPVLRIQNIFCNKK